MLRNIPSATLKQLVRLSERKERLMAQIQEIDREMLRVQDRFGIPAVEGDQRAPVTVSRSRSGPLRPRSKRGVLKEKIIRALRGAGKKGATISELSKKLKVPNANLYVWFNGTGRNVRGIKKIGVAKYQLR
jgi:hypothetical protein